MPDRVRSGERRQESFVANEVVVASAGQMCSRAIRPQAVSKYGWMKCHPPPNNTAKPGLEVHKHQWCHMRLDTCMMHRSAYAARGRAGTVLQACCACMRSSSGPGGDAIYRIIISCMECVVQRPALVRADPKHHCVWDGFLPGRAQCTLSVPHHLAPCEYRMSVNILAAVLSPSGESTCTARTTSNIAW